MLQLPLRWPKRILGPTPTLKEINVICWGLFLALLVLPVSLVLRDRLTGGEARRALDADFVYFYSAGRILNEYPADKLYDYELEKKVCTEVHPLDSGTYGPFPYPPFVAMFFSLFARLSYPVAYGLWLCISLVLYIAGLTILSARFFSHDPLLRSLILCFALAFFPFTIETLINGQISVIGFFALAVTLREEDVGHSELSGLALSVCLYKPTLLVLVLPMLLVTRRFRTLEGFGIGAAALVLFTTLVEGTHVWSGYLNLLLYFGKASTGANARSFLRLQKYVHLNAFSLLVPGGHSWPGLAIVFGFAAWAVVSLLRVWWKSIEAGRPANILVWATTLTWTLLLSLYAAIHESIIVVLSIIATAGVLKESSEKLLYRWFTLLWLLIFGCSWITERVTAATGVQILTISFAALGVLQLVVLHRFED